MKKSLSFILILCIVFSLTACAEQETTELVLENISESQYLLLMAAAAVINDPQAEQYDLSSLSGGYVFEVLEKTPSAEDPDTFVYSLKVDTRYRLGFYNLVFPVEEYQQILAWQEETGVQLLYPLVAHNQYAADYDADSRIAYSYNANIWFQVSEDLVPLDPQGNPQTGSDTPVLLPNYLCDSDGEPLYFIQNVAGYVCRVSLGALYLYQYGTELTLPFDSNEELFFDYYSRLIG